MKYKHACVICEWNLLFCRLDLAYFTEKNDFSFDDLAGPVKNMAIPQHGFRPAKKINKFMQLRTQKYQNGLHKQVKATTKLTLLRSN